MNSSYTTEQEDIDEMSGYAKARRQAAIKHREAQKGSWWKTLMAIIITLLLMWWMSGCADVVDVDKCLPEEPYGFWSGLWHGWIAPFAWIGSLFNDDISVYAINNSGGWYDFGFILGIGGLSFGSSKASSK